MPETTQRILYEEKVPAQNKSASEKAIPVTVPASSRVEPATFSVSKTWVPKNQVPTTLALSAK